MLITLIRKSRKIEIRQIKKETILLLIVIPFVSCTSLFYINLIFSENMK